MLRTLALCAALMLVSAAAYAALPISQTITMHDEFSAWDRPEGSNLNDGLIWGGDATTQFTYYNDGGNMCIKAGTNTVVSGVRYAFAGGPHGAYGAAMATYAINRMHFEAKVVTTGSTRWDKNNVVMFSNGTVYAYGSSYGMGFAVLTDGARPSYGLGANNSYWPDNAWTGTQVSVEATWHAYDMVWDRTTNIVEWYKDEVLIQTQDASTWEWAIQNGQQRWMNHFEFVSCGKDTTTGVWLYDNVYMAGAAIPEPASLIALSAFGLGALGFIRRRKA